MKLLVQKEPPLITYKQKSEIAQGKKYFTVCKSKKIFKIRQESVGKTKRYFNQQHLIVILENLNTILISTFLK